MLHSDCFSFDNTQTANHFLFLQNSWVVYSYSVIGKVHYGWHLGWHCNTPARKNFCVPATSTQAERVFSWMGWLLKKWALSGRRICQHATILEGQCWALDCFCHCDVFSKINWILSFLDFLINGFIFLTSESIICRKLPYNKYI